MICQVCSQETEGRNLNGRGLRCTFCGARLVIPEAVEAAPAVEIELATESVVEVEPATAKSKKKQYGNKKA